MKRTELSLCVIARDEETRLPDCLASARGCVDRIVVVDTGSRDRTPEIALEAGAELLRHPWGDDFAAARNAALEAVGSGFVLVLDADERLAPGAGEILRRALDDDDFDLGLLPLHHADGLDAAPEAVLSGERRLGDPVRLPRLLRRTPDLRWQGVVHEDVSEWARGRRAKPVEAAIVHYGACPELRQREGKDARNLALLQIRSAQEPDNAWVRAYLARELARAGRAEAALSEARAGWQALRRARERGDGEADAILIGTVLGHLLLEAGELAEMTGVVGQAAEWSDGHPNFWFLAGVAAEQHAMAADDARAMLDEAARCYRACLQDRRPVGGEPIPGSRGWQGWTRLGTVELRRNDPGAALQAFESALVEKPGFVEALLGRSEVRLRQGEAEAALADLLPLAEDGCLDAWLLGAVAASQLGSDGDAALFASRALDLASGTSLVAPHRGGLLRELTEAGAEPDRSATAGGDGSAPAPGSNARSVVVLGSGRSGTSMVAGTLAQAGWFVGDDPYPARDSNPKGFFETSEINGLNEALLGAELPASRDLGDGQRWLAEVPREADWSVRPELEARMRTLCARRPFAYKDPRFCATLPAWRPLLGDVGYVCVFRSPAITAESILRECQSQAYLRGVEMDFERALRLWTSLYRQILAEHRHEGDWLFLHYDQLLGGDGLDRLEAFVGAPVARDFPEASLSRCRSERALPAEVAELYDELCGLAGWRAEALPRETPAPRAVQDGEPRLSVILCTYERREILERSLEAWQVQDAAPGSFELVVVDDGSSDGTAELLAQTRFRVPARVVSRANGGLAAARNSGIEVARGELLLFVNDDTIPFPDLVRRHIEVHDAHPGESLAVLGSFEQPEAARANALTRLLEETELVFGYAALQAGERYDWNRFWTCNVSVPAGAVRDAGGFDESFRHYGAEDTDLGLRLFQRGLPVHYEPSLRAHHHHVLSLDDLERRGRTVARAWLRLFRKHPEAVGASWFAQLPQELAACERFVIDRLPRLPVWRRAARELAALDVSAIEQAGGTALAQQILRALEIPVRCLHEVAWREGIAEGLREHGVSSCAELARAGSGDRSCTVLAWPRYTESAVDELLAEWGPELAGRPGTQLCLVHDPAGDGAADAAVNAIERAYARHVPDDAALDVEIIDPPKDADALAALRERIDATLELPGSDEPGRSTLLEEIGAPRLRDPKAKGLPTRAPPAARGA